MGNGFGALRARIQICTIATGLAVAIAAPAAAEWTVYTSADLGFSIAETDGDGTLQSPSTAFPLAGDDDDVSPFLGGAIGLEVPLTEASPWQMPRWLEGFAVREEVEIVGLRNYKFTTDPPTGNNQVGKVQTEVDAWSVMVNTWFDIPLDGLYRPISWTSARLFGRWRLRTLKQILARTTLTGGAGIGATFIEAQTDVGGASDKQKSNEFAWQVGGGFGYQLSDRVNLSFGYRYIDPGKTELSLRGGVASPTLPSNFEIDPEIHEARATLRVSLYDFPTPWRR